MKTKNEEIGAVEAAKLLGHPLDYVYRLLLVGKLAGRKMGRRWLVSASAVEARLKEREARNG